MKTFLLNLKYDLKDFWFHYGIKSWYCEYPGNIRIHDYFSIMINQFPILVIRKLDDPHSENENMDGCLCIGILGFTFTKIFK